MNAVNLIPIHRQLRDARAARVRGWSWAVGGLSALLAMAWVCCAMAPSQAVAPPAAAFTKATAEISKANEESAVLRRELAALRDQALSTRGITDQPDFSVLLALLSQAIGQDVVLNRCELSHDDLKTTSAPEQVLKISGFARNQPAVAAFMLELESTGIFKSVTLVRSNEEPWMDQKVAGFQVHCAIGPVSRGKS
jgi:Tfp pilus assembly protein PilN